MDMRIGLGYDIHKLASGRPLVLGGIEIPHSKGLWGHSDGDALLHAIADAWLGVAGMGDIGEHFPDTDSQFKDADSSELLKTVVQAVSDAGWQVVNLDANIIAQAPRLNPYRTQMQARIAELLGVETHCVNIKARTNEKMDAVGQLLAIATQAVVLLKKSQQ